MIANGDTNKEGKRHRQHGRRTFLQDVTDRSNERHGWGSTVHPLTVKHRGELKWLAFFDTGPDERVGLSQKVMSTVKDVSQNLADRYDYEGNQNGST
jgi:hypothetical protein